MELGLADPHGFAFTMDTANNLQQIEGKLSQLAQDHLFDEAGSMIDFRSKRASEMASQSGVSVHRPFSASTRLTAGGSGSSRADTESVASGKVAPSVLGSEARSWRAGEGAPSENGGRNDESVSAPRSERVVRGPRCPQIAVVPQPPVAVYMPAASGAACWDSLALRLRYTVL